MSWLYGFLLCFVAVQAASSEAILNLPPDNVSVNIDPVLATLANVAMQEKISRFVGAGGSARQLDSFEAQVSIADGVEQYTGVKGQHRTYRHVSEIGGLWSFGEIVTMLRSTRDIIDSSPMNHGDNEAGQTIIRFHSAASDHQWFVTDGGRIYWLGFDGALRLSETTGEIQRLTWTSGLGLPGAGIASILWDVNFRAVEIAGKTCIMPSDSIYRVVRRGRNQPAEWNLTQYAALGRYGSSVSLSFGQ